jgi:Dolichyl-phosphate-mannose-protein mannosyltransferase
MRPFTIPPVSETKPLSRVVWILAATTLIFHVLTAGRYGIFRDELYYLACAEHLAWGYVDQPPLIAFIAWIARHLFGESLIGLRFLPALAGAVTVWWTGKLSAEIGGGRFAQAMAALAVLATPVYMIMHHWLTMNAFEPLLWVACAWCVVRAINRSEAHYWIWFGLLAGLGLENKYTTVFFLVAVAVGVLVTSTRRFLRTKQLWIGVAVAIALFLPNLIWLVVHHFPFLELMHNIRQGHRDVFRGPVGFVVDQIQLLNPALAPLWMGGLIWLLVSRNANKYRVFGILYLVMLAMFIVLRGKNYYLAPIYPILFAAGAAAFEEITAVRGRWIRAAYVAVVVVAMVVIAPTTAPILSPESAIEYTRRLGLAPPKAENQDTGPLPQYFADEFGWEEMTREVSRIFHALPPDEQARTAIFANSYGQAGAIDFFGPRYGLPKVICPHQNYWFWGPRQYDGSTVIVLGSDGRGDREHFDSVERAGRTEHPYSRRDEQYDIFVCRGLRVDLQKIWPTLKHWN